MRGVRGYRGRERRGIEGGRDERNGGEKGGEKMGEGEREERCREREGEMMLNYSVLCRFLLAISFPS